MSKKKTISDKPITTTTRRRRRGRHSNNHNLDFNLVSDDEPSSSPDTKLIAKLMSLARTTSRPIHAALIDHLSYNTNLVINVGRYVVNTLGWDLKFYDADTATKVILDRFNDLLIFVPYLNKFTELKEAITKLHEGYLDYKLLAESLIQLFPLKCSYCNNNIQLWDKDVFFRFNVIMYMNKLAIQQQNEETVDKEGRYIEEGDEDEEDEGEEDKDSGDNDDVEETRE